MFVLFAAVVLLFGAKSLPGFARQFGRVMEELRRASWDFKRQMMEADHEIRQATADVSKDMKDLTDLDSSPAPYDDGHAEGHDDYDYDADHAEYQDDDYHDYHKDHPEQLDDAYERSGDDLAGDVLGSVGDAVISSDNDLPQADKPEPGGEPIVARGALDAEAPSEPSDSGESEPESHPNLADHVSRKDPPTHG